MTFKNLAHRRSADIYDGVLTTFPGRLAVISDILQKFICLTGERPIYRTPFNMPHRQESDIFDSGGNIRHSASQHVSQFLIGIEIVDMQYYL